MTKAEQLAAFYRRTEEILSPFVAFGQVVPGVGNIDAELVLIGEAPGKNEAETGIPFVGQAGKELDELLALGGIERSQIYITNAVKFRPVKPGAKEGTYTNRPPTAKERKFCRDLLLEELSILQPKIVATLGNTPLKALLEQSAPTVGDAHGRALTSPDFPFPVVPLYHPASVLYNRSLRETLEADIQKLGTMLRV